MTWRPTDTLKKYDYPFPKELVALRPTSPRDRAKLLVYNRKTNQTSENIFLHLPKYLPSNAVLVFNQTKVIPARLELKKETGGKVEILILENKGGTLKILADRKLSGSTDLFIQEGYKFKFIDDLITNFHVPKSSLLMLVSSLTGRKKLLEVYSRAIKHSFRLFSFGDGMLIV